MPAKGFSPGWVRPAILVVSILAAGDAACAQSPGAFVWARAAGGAGTDLGNAVAVMPDGGCAVTGFYVGPAVFGAGTPTSTTLPAVGSTDVFVARYNAAGDLLWARHAGGASIDQGTGIAALGDGGVLVAGFIRGSAVFGSGTPAETTITTVGSYYRIFLARYAADGALGWVKCSDGSSAISMPTAGVAALADGRSRVAAGFSSSINWGQGEANETTLTASGTDITVAAFNADGTLAWAKRAGGNQTDYAYGVAVRADGTAFVTGTFGTNCVFGSGEPGQVTLNPFSLLDLFVASYNADGTIAWAKGQDLANSTDFGRAVAVATDGGILVSGFSTSPNPGGVVAKYSTTGTLLWSRPMGLVYTYGVAPLAGGGALVAGEMAGTVTLGAGEPDQTTLTLAGNSDILYAGYRADGTLAWARRAGGTNPTGPGTDTARAAAANEAGRAYVTGAFDVQATFGPGEPTETTLTAPGGQNDAVVLRIGVPNITRAEGWELYP